MADETPEQIKEKILAEELAKGSDPRVAEARSKAAELRARQGLPIDPQQAWRAKLEKEGGAAPAAEAVEEPQAEVQAAPTQEAPAEAPDEPKPVTEEPAAEEPAPAEQPQTAPAPSPVQAPVPAGVEVQRESAEIVPAAAAVPAVAPSREIQFEPEIGEMVEFDTEDMAEVAGIRLADARLPGWLIAVFIALVGAAVIYLLVFSGPGAAEEASGCRVDANRAVVCGSTDSAPATSEETTH